MQLLLLLFLPACAIGQELTLYIIPPAKKISWRSPQTLFLGYARNSIAKNKYPGRRHILGHVMVELRDSTHHAIVGIVPVRRSEMTYKFFHRGYGMTMLFAGIHGRMQSEYENIAQINERYPNGDIAYIRFRLGSQNFARLWQYLNEYKWRGYDAVYNGENKPREGKGAGCSAFAVSFIQLAGLLDTAETRHWQVGANIPEYLMGGPEYNKRVSPFKVIFKRKWADTLVERYRKITLYDPFLMYEWVNTTWGRTGNVNSGYQKEIRGNANGLYKDCSHLSVPKDPIWLSEQ